MEYIFDDVLEIRNGKNQKTVENPDGKYPIYGSGGIMGYADDYICEANTVIVGRKGSINNPIYVSEPFWNVDTAFGLTAKREVLLPRYLFYFCKKFDFEKLNKTVTIPSLTKSDLLKIKINLPELNKQQEIIDKLSQIENIIDLRKKMLLALDDLIKSRFVELFGLLKEEQLLGDMSEFVTVGIANSATHAYTESGIPMLRNQNIRKNHLDDSDLIYIKPEFAAKYESKKLKENDIIVMRTGYPGVACLVPKQYEGCQTFTTLIVRLKPGNNPSYVCNYINSDFGKQFIESEKVGVAQQNVGAKSLAKMPIKIAPKKLQDEFAAFVKQLDKLKAITKQSIDELQILFDSLMQKYFG